MKMGSELANLELDFITSLIVTVVDLNSLNYFLPSSCKVILLKIWWLNEPMHCISIKWEEITVNKKIFQKPKYFKFARQHLLVDSTIIMLSFEGRHMVDSVQNVKVLDNTETIWISNNSIEVLEVNDWRVVLCPIGMELCEPCQIERVVVKLIIPWRFWCNQLG